MGKDPAFLFYPADWLEGTMLFSRIEKACYLDLLLAQNANGHLTLEDIKNVLGVDFPIWERIRGKFDVDDKGRFYNDKMNRVRQERDNFVTSRIKNLHMGRHKGSRMGSRKASHGGDGNGDRDIDKKREVMGGEARARFDIFWSLYPTRRGKKIGKAEAEIAFSILSPADQEAVLVAVKNYAASDTLPKDPVRFIRKDYWREWLEPETPQPARGQVSTRSELPEYKPRTDNELT